MTKALTKSRRQGVEVDVFDRHDHVGISILATASCCLAYQLPIGCTVTGAPETVTLDKRFYQVERVSVLLLPICADSFQYGAEQMACQMRHFDPWQDEKTGIVRHQEKSLGPNGISPADELVSGLGFPGSGTKKQAGHVASMSILNQVFQVLSSSTLKTQIVVACQVVIEEMFFK
jgi:hypothetical protein